MSVTLNLGMQAQILDYLPRWFVPHVHSLVDELSKLNTPHVWPLGLEIEHEMSGYKEDHHQTYI